MQRGRRQAAVEITPSPEEKADSLLAALIDHGLAEILEGDEPVRILYVSDPVFLDVSWPKSAAGGSCLSLP